MHKIHKKQSSFQWHVLLWIPVALCCVTALLFAFKILPLKPAVPSMPEDTTPPLQTTASTPFLTATPETAPEPSPTNQENTDEPDAPPAIGVALGKPANKPQVRYELAAILTEAYNRLTATMRVQYTNTTGDTLFELVFQLPANAYATGDSLGSRNEAQSYQREFHKGGVIISAVSLNNVLTYHRISDDTMRLHVPFAMELAPGESAEVLIEFVLDIPQKNGRYGYTALGYQMGNCFPVLAVYQDSAWMQDSYAAWGDPFYSEVSDYAVALTYPASYQLAATGSIVSEKSSGGTTTSYVAGSNLREFACMLLSGVEKEEQFVSGIHLKAYALSKTSTQRCLQLAEQALSVFQPYLGAYPYETLTITQAELYNASGMEYPSMIMVQRELFLPGQEQRLAFTIAHEIAHQWFYAIVGSDQINAPWIDEAFAAYFGFLPLQHAENKDAYTALHQHYLVERARNGLEIDGTIEDYRNELDYADSVYWRGAAMLEALEGKLGGEVFYEGIALYLKENAYRIATKADIIAAFEAAANEPLADWFAGWLANPSEETQSLPQQDAA